MHLRMCRYVRLPMSGGTVVCGPCLRFCMCRIYAGVFLCFSLLLRVVACSDTAVSLFLRLSDFHAAAWRIPSWFWSSYLRLSCVLQGGFPSVARLSLRVAWRVPICPLWCSFFFAQRRSCFVNFVDDWFLLHASVYIREHRAVAFPVRWMCA